MAQELLHLFKSVPSFILVKMSSKKAPRLWPRSFLRYSVCYLRHFAACKSTSVHYLQGLVAPRAPDLDSYRVGRVPSPLRERAPLPTPDEKK